MQCKIKKKKSSLPQERILVLLDGSIAVLKGEAAIS